MEEYIKERIKKAIQEKQEAKSRDHANQAGSSSVGSKTLKFYSHTKSSQQKNNTRQGIKSSVRPLVIRGPQDWYKLDQGYMPSK